MSSNISGIEIIQSFIKIAEEIERLPRISLPQYQKTAKGLAKIAYMILEANCIVIKWLNEFLFTGFLSIDSKKSPESIIDRYNTSVKQYNNMKGGTELHTLKFRCGDIRKIYKSNVKNKLNNMFSEQSKRDDVEAIFRKLSESDETMVMFVTDQIIKRLDEYTSGVNKILRSPSPAKLKLANAEREKWKFNLESEDLVQQLIQINHSLTDLVVKFGEKTDTPISDYFSRKGPP